MNKTKKLLDEINSIIQELEVKEEPVSKIKYNSAQAREIANTTASSEISSDEDFEENQIKKRALLQKLVADARYDDISCWIKIIAAPIIYILIIVEVITMIIFVNQNINLFESKDIAIIFGAILAQSFGVVYIVTKGLYSVKSESDSQSPGEGNLVEKFMNK